MLQILNVIYLQITKVGLGQWFLSINSSFPVIISQLQDRGWILEDVLPGLSVKGQKNLLMDGNRFLLTGMIKGFPSYISTIKSNLQKPLTTINGMESKPKEALLALGMAKYSVQSFIMGPLLQSGLLLENAKIA